MIILSTFVGFLINLAQIHGVKIGGSILILRTLNISYVVVHTKDSGEFYHDFLYPQKFENISSLTKIYEKDGDVIYQVGD